MSKHTDKYAIRIVGVAALLLSFWFVYSVIMNVRDLVQHDIKNAPASYALMGCFVLLAYAWFKNGKKLTILHIVTLVIVATSAVIWAAGLTVPTGG